MDKQELIEELECLEVSTCSLDYLKGADYANERAISLAKQLDESKKAVLPKFVADELEKLADKYLTLRDLYASDVNWLNNGTVYLEGKELELANWVNKNETIFEYAWIHGYEVEKEI
nr:DUF1642 domain-containing protein [Enterococcus faecalis]